jgi:5-methyltetrahydropteroyltriglutamate--homocysteine methyltransferase
VNTTVLGYPRIGPRRELKHAVEKYWSGGDAEELETTARQLRAGTWRDLAGLDTIPGNTFSYYDQMLDHVELFGAIPERFRGLGLSDLDASRTTWRSRTSWTHASVNASPSPARRSTKSSHSDAL